MHLFLPSILILIVSHHLKNTLPKNKTFRLKKAGKSMPLFSFSFSIDESKHPQKSDSLSRPSGRQNSFTRATQLSRRRRRRRWRRCRATDLRTRRKPNRVACTTPPRTHGLNLSLSLARTSILSYEVNLSYAFSLMTLTHPPKCIRHTMSFLKAWFSASLSTCLSGYFTEQKCSNELTERWDSNWGSQMFLFQVTVLGTNCVPVNAPC